jgi:hypothetical protein
MKRFRALPPLVMTSGASAVARADSPLVGGARQRAMERERWKRAVACALTMLSVSPLLSAMSRRALAADTGPLCDPSRSAIVYRPGMGPEFARDRTTLVPCRYDTGVEAGEPSFGFGRGGRIFYEAWHLEAPANPSGVVRSNPQHTMWTDVSPLGLVTSFDPFLLVDPRTKRVFDVNFAGNGDFGCSTLSYSDDDGTTWTTRVLCDAGFDAESIGVGPPVSSKTVGYPNIVYYCASATLGSAPPASTPVCLKSLDGGATFVPITSPYPLLGAQDEFAPWAGPPIVGPDGTVYVPKRYGGEPFVAVSHDEGGSWTDVQVAANGSASEANRAAVDARGNVYYTWVADDHLPYLATSSDEGQTWSAPVQLAPPGVRETALARIGVDSASGDAAVVYLGSVNAPGVPPFFSFCQEFLQTCSDGAYADTTWNGYITLIHNPLKRHPLLSTATVNAPDDPLLIGGCSPDGGCKAAMDFLDVHFDSSGHPWGAFVDDCALVANPGSPAVLLNPQFGRCGDGTGEGILGELVPLPDSESPHEREGSAGVVDSR